MGVKVRTQGREDSKYHDDDDIMIPGPPRDGVRCPKSGLRAAAVGALHPASSAPSRVHLSRAGALESPQPGLPSRVGRDKCTRDAAEKSWPEVRLFDAPLAGRARLPAKSFC